MHNPGHRVSEPPLSNFPGGRRYNSVPASSYIPVVTQKTEPADRFDQLFAEHYAPLARLLYRVVGDTGRAEELASEAFWKLHRDSPSSDHNLAGWLFRTGFRLALDDLKKRKRREHYEALAPPPGETQTPEQAAQQLEQRTRVRRVLVALKPAQSELLMLRSEGYSLAEIAAVLVLNPNSVGTLLARADSAFRKEYVNRYGER